MKKTVKKLMLSKETVRSQELLKVQGGQEEDCSVNTCGSEFMCPTVKCIAD